MMKSDSQLPRISSGMVFNKRLIILLVGGSVVFIGFFIGMLQMSAPKKVTRETNAPFVDNQAAMEMIHRLQRKKLPHSESTVNEVEDVILEEERFNPLLVTQFDNGSAISVFRQANPPAFEVEHRQSTQEVAVPDISMPVMPNDYKQQNQQNEKKIFLSKRIKANASELIGFEPSAASCAIKAGSVIPAILQTAINSDLPGTIIGKVRQSVFDSVSGRYLLIPQGSTLLGQYDADVAYGQHRILIAWQQLIFPNGDSYQLEGQPGVDGLGAAGLKDKIDNHLLRIFSGSLMFSVLSVGSSLQMHHHETEHDNLQSDIGDPVAQKMAQTGMSMLNKNLNIQPTLIARVGMRFNVLLRQDLVFPGVYCG